MKRIVLLRHAKSSWSDATLADHDRPLAARGLKDARRIAKFVAQSDLRLDLVLCSSALRACQTWAELEKRVEPRFGARITRELYMPSREELLHCLKQVPSQAQIVMIIGHNPALEAFALSLVHEGEPSLRAQMLEKFPTAALCAIDLTGGIEEWATLDRVHGLQGRLSGLVRPKDLTANARASAPIKAHVIELEHKPRWRSTAVRVFDATIAQLRDNAVGAAQGRDAEYVHQMRVAVRRLRTALSFFGDLLPESESEHLGQELRWLFGLLGPLRECDVVLEHVLPSLEPAAGLETLRESIVEQRREFLAELAGALGSTRFERLVSELVECQAHLSQRDQRRSPETQSARA